MYLFETMKFLRFQFGNYNACDKAVKLIVCTDNCTYFYKFRNGVISKEMSKVKSERYIHNGIH